GPPSGSRCLRDKVVATRIALVNERAPLEHFLCRELSGDGAARGRLACGRTASSRRKNAGEWAVAARNYLHIHRGSTADISGYAQPRDRSLALRQRGRHRLDDRVDPITPELGAWPACFLDGPCALAALRLTAGVVNPASLSFINRELSEIGHDRLRYRQRG